jgi:hypothetical protein
MVLPATTMTGRRAYLAAVATSAGLTGGWLALRIVTWPGIWAQTVQALGDSTILLAPWAGVLGTMRALRYRRAGVRDLAQAAARPQAVVIAREMGRATAQVSIGFLGVAAIAMGWTATHSSYGRPNLLHLATAIPYLAAAVSIGFVLGFLVKHPATPLLTFLALFILPYQAVVHELAGWGNLIPGDQPILVFSDKLPRLFFMQILLFVAIAAAGIIITSGLRVILPLPLAVGVGSAVALLVIGTDGTRPDPAARALVCRAGEPRVCLTAVQSFQAEELQSTTTRLSSLVAPLHPQTLVLVDADASPEAAASVPGHAVPVSLIGGKSNSVAIFDREKTLNGLIPTLVGNGRCEPILAPDASADATVLPPPRLTLNGEVVSWLLASEKIDPPATAYWRVIPPGIASSGLAQALARADPKRREAWLVEHRQSIADCGTQDGHLP